jgi:hypothetical protein
MRVLVHPTLADLEQRGDVVHGQQFMEVIAVIVCAMSDVVACRS